MPCTLGPVSALAYYRRELGALWVGKPVLHAATGGQPLVGSDAPRGDEGIALTAVDVSGARSDGDDGATDRTTDMTDGSGDGVGAAVLASATSTPHAD